MSGQTTLPGNVKQQVEAEFREDRSCRTIAQPHPSAAHAVWGAAGMRSSMWPNLVFLAMRW
jgi:hypothetical protein